MKPNRKIKGWRKRNDWRVPAHYDSGEYVWNFGKSMKKKLWRNDD